MKNGEAFKTYKKKDIKLIYNLKLQNEIVYSQKRVKLKQ